MSEFAEFVYNIDFKDLHNKNLVMMTWLPHTLITYLQKYFQACTPALTKPNNLSNIMVRYPIDPRTYEEAESLLPLLMDIIRSCVIGDNMGMLACPLALNHFSSPPPPPLRENLKIHPRRRKPRLQKSPQFKILPIHLHGPRDTLLTPALTRSPPSHEDDSQPVLPEANHRGFHLPKFPSLPWSLYKRLV